MQLLKLIGIFNILFIMTTMSMQSIECRADEINNTDQTLGIVVPNAINLRDIYSTIYGKKVVYIGETHDRYEDHLVQLEILNALYAKNPDIAIGMEMFERINQPALDAYIKGEIDEREFLKRSHYFRSWGYEYNLYKGLIDFAREKNIPIIALNIDREIVSKVSKSGFKSLNETEKTDLPLTLDLSDNEYKTRIREIFLEHKELKGRSFDNFFEAQVLWDESMAMALNDYIEGTPDRQIVVFTGNGHIEYGSGIPERLGKRNGLDYTIILNGERLAEKIGDYILYPKPVECKESPLLMARLDDSKKGIVRIKGLVKGSPLKKSGIRAKDIILSLDGVKIEDIEDVRIALFYKKKGDMIKISYKRGRASILETDATLE